MAKTDKNAINRLYKAVLKLKTEAECENFFNDICTMQEVEAIAQRLDVACKLLNGKVYTEISADTGASTATISRVNRSLQYGCNGYEEIFKRMQK